MDEQLARPTLNNSLQDKLNTAFTDWLDWFQAKPPFAIDVKNLEVAAVTSEMCGLAGPPMKPNAFDLAVSMLKRRTLPRCESATAFGLEAGNADRLRA